MDVVEKSFSSRLMKDRAKSQAAPSGVSWPLGRPSAATFSFGLVVCLPAAPHNSRGNMQITRAISNGQEWDCGFFTYTASFIFGKHSLPIVTLLWAGALVRQGQRGLSQARFRVQPFYHWANVHNAFPRGLTRWVNHQSKLRFYLTKQGN